MAKHSKTSRRGRMAECLRDIATVSAQVVATSNKTVLGRLRKTLMDLSTEVQRDGTAADKRKAKAILHAAMFLMRSQHATSKRKRRTSRKAARRTTKRVPARGLASKAAVAAWRAAARRTSRR